MLDDWLRVVFIYRPENEEVIRTPELMMNQLRESGTFEGDCDDAATLVAAILYSANVPSRFVALRVPGDSEYSHVFVEWFDGQSWLVIDPTVPVGTEYVGERMVMDI